ncbi:MAG: methyltransferase [Mariprofundaceae bacterium]|nr:methyltransferase [Mariprofundaceae bacterium]
MMEDAARLLYQNAPTDVPVVVCNAYPDSLLYDLKTSALIQDDRTQALKLLQMNLDVENELDGEHQHILLLPHKQTQQSAAWMAKAILALEEGGTLTMCCANKMGARGYQKRLTQLAGMDAHCVSKNKCRLFHVKRTDKMDVDLAQSWLKSGSLQWVEGLDLFSSPGLFSWNRADKGSELLLKHVPKDLSGVGMDVGCGNGILSASLLKRNQGIKELYLYDSSWPAIKAAQKNAVAPEGVDVHVHHLDAVHEAFHVKPNWIVLNPPFHHGQQQDTELGQDMIVKCCKAIKRGGTLYMVANRHLPYEQILSEHASSWTELAAAQGFKVLRAEK